MLANGSPGIGCISYAGSDPVQLVTPSCPHTAAAILPIAALTDSFKIAVIYFLNAHYNSDRTA